ncbi:Aldo/keto reductase [Cubamyces menziesii]|nr:Aldo/keto reductase [Cubamyces menziesii]
MAAILRQSRSLQFTSTVRLNTGYSMPILGFGVAYGFDKPTDTHAVTKPSVLEALRAGYRHIDTARCYRNEVEVGEAIRESGVPREDTFVTTKIDSSLHGYESTLSTVKASLSDLGLDYIDLYLIHDAGSGQELRLATYRALLEAKALGEIRSVGVSNYGVKHLEELQQAGLPPPAVNQIELHPLCQQRPIVDYCREHGIVVQAYCPIIRGRTDHPVIKELSEKYEKEPAQVLIRWSLQHGFVPLPKSSQAARIRSNAQVFDFELTDADMAALDSLDKGKAGAVSWNPVDVA